MKKNLLVLLASLLFLVSNIFHTHAQGYTKIFEQTGGTHYFTDLWFVPQNQWQTGWLLSTSSVFKTTNGGNTWTEYSNGLSAGCSHICFVDENTGYISNGSGKIYKSVDGGENWTNIYTSSTNNLGEIAFKDAQHGVCAGNQMIYTSDGGASWQVSANTADCDNMHYAGGDTYYATDGYTKSIFKSTDGGQSFTLIKTVSEYIETSSFPDEDHGLAGGTYQVLNLTENGGQSWQIVVVGDGVDNLLSSAYFDTDTLFVAGEPEVFKSVDGGTIWSVDASITGEHKSMFVTGTNAIYVTSIINNLTMQLWKKQGFLPLVSDFEADETDICENSSVQFTDLSYFDVDSWNWSFEGGTPSSSSAQNPSVTYTAPGQYNVTLTIGREGESASLTRTDYIRVYELPEAPGAPEGQANICNGFDYAYSVPLDVNVQSYTWEISPTAAGNLLVNFNEATLEADNTWTGDFTIKVKSTNVCGDSPWSENFEGTQHSNPVAFAMTGGGVFCEGGPGVEIGLDGSEVGVSYNVYRDGILIGNYPGTGEALSFGLVNVAGTYETSGSTDFCTVYMQNQVLVIASSVPGQAGIPEGPEMVCQENSTEYISNGASGADGYQWFLEPAEAGELSPSGLEVTITWNSGFSGMASLSVVGTNECGEGEASTSLEIAVNYLPAPEINGLNLVCDLEDVNYSVAEHAGNTYNWDVSGGTVSSGQGTSEVVITWGAPGMGNIVVTEDNENGCTGESEIFVVTIDECTDINEPQAGNKFVLFPNPASDKLTITVASTSDLLVYSISGQLLLQQTGITGTYHLDVSGLENGAYILKAVGNNYSFSARFIINR